VVQAAEDVACDDVSTALDGSVIRGILTQAEMGPGRVIVGDIISQDALQDAAGIQGDLCQDQSGGPNQCRCGGAMSEGAAGSMDRHKRNW